MATIDDKSLVRTLLECNGHYDDDPQCFSIWSYTNDWGKETNAVFWSLYNQDIRTSPFCHDPKLLWQKNHGITLEGQKWLQKYVEQEKETA